MALRGDAVLWVVCGTNSTLALVAGAGPLMEEPLTEHLSPDPPKAWPEDASPSTSTSPDQSETREAHERDLIHAVRALRASSSARRENSSSGRVPGVLVRDCGLRGDTLHPGKAKSAIRSVAIT